LCIGGHLSVTESLEKKKETLRVIAKDFASGNVDERTYQEKTSALFAEIAELKSRVEQEENLKKQYEVTYTDIIGFPVFVEDKVVGKVSGITVFEGRPALSLAGVTCPRCKALLEENAKFCVECGAAV
jgi:hypothetical protein